MTHIEELSAQTVIFGVTAMLFIFGVLSMNMDGFENVRDHRGERHAVWVADAAESVDQLPGAERHVTFPQAYDTVSLSSDQATITHSGETYTANVSTETPITAGERDGVSEICVAHTDGTISFVDCEAGEE